MHCLQCHVVLNPLRTMTDGDFCSDQHRMDYSDGGPGAGHLFSPEPKPRGPAAMAGAEPPEPLPLPPLIRRPGSESAPEPPPPELPSSGLVPWAAVVEVNRLRDDSLPLTARGLTPAAAWPTLSTRLRTSIPGAGKGARTRLDGFPWQFFPTKLMVAILPFLIVAALDPLIIQHSVAAASEARSSQGSPPIIRQLEDGLRQRAAILLADDFRTGLDDWRGRSSVTTNWSYDQGGFVRPNALAVYRPTMSLYDYRIEFLALIEQQALGVAYRIEDFNHYYALKLEVSDSGPIPALEMVRYAVVGGRQAGRVTRRLLPNMLGSSLYRFRLDAHGGDFTLMLQDQIVDYWTDGRYPKGGIGFFCGRGERARLRWVEVSHQYDAIGRLCAWLAPFDGQMNNGRWNQP